MRGGMPGKSANGRAWGSCWGGFQSLPHSLAASWATPFGSRTQFPWASVVETMDAGLSVLHHT